MANPTIKQNRKTITEPTLHDLLQLLKKDIMLNLTSMHVGTIVSFDEVRQTVEAKINYKKTFFQKTTDDNYAPVLKDYPPLVDVPLIVLQGGGAALTMPIAAGDECLLLFNDRDIDNWFESGQVTGNASGRMHSFSDAFALVGVNSLVNSISNYDSTRASLRYGDTRVAVGEEKVLIENNTTTLNTLLQALMTQLTALTTQLALLTVTGVTTGPGTSGVPVNAAAITAIGVQLNSIKTNIGGLLE